MEEKEGVEAIYCDVVKPIQHNVEPLSRVSQKKTGISRHDNMFRRNTFSKIKIALILAVAFFAILATIFGVMYFAFAEKPCKDKLEVSKNGTAATLKEMKELLKKTEKELEVLTNVLALKVGSYQMPGNSCADIVHRTKKKLLLSSQEYWIVIDNDKPMKVFCDMKSDGGGWTLITNIVLQDSRGFTWSLENDYRKIKDYTSNKLGLSVQALEALRHKMPFTQLMFYCHKKQPGRTFHIVTKQNTLGNDVLHYFTGRTDSLPEACGSFTRLSDDNSIMAGNCSRWGGGPGKYFIGKWHHVGYPRERRLTIAAFLAYTAHWLFPNKPLGRWECDDYKETNGYARTAGDFWKIFVR